MSTAPALIIPNNVFSDIQHIVSEAEDVYEPGITLFGVPMDSKLLRKHCVVLAVAKTGLESAVEPTLDGQNVEYLSFSYRLLRDELPSLCWLGALHVHPAGMHWLTVGDKSWVQALLTGGSEGIQCPEAFIAGVLYWGKEAIDFVHGIPQRRENTLDFFPCYFTRECPDGLPVNCISYVESDSAIIKEARDVAAESRAPRPGVIAPPRTHGNVIELYYWEHCNETGKFRIKIERKKHDH